MDRDEMIAAKPVLYLVSFIGVRFEFLYFKCVLSCYFWSNGILIMDMDVEMVHSRTDYIWTPFYYDLVGNLYRL